MAANSLPRVSRDPSTPRSPNRVARTLNAIVFWGILGVVPLSIVFYGTVDAWWEAVIECAIFGLTAIWTIEAVFARGFRIPRLSLLLPMLVITAYVFVQCIQWPPSFLSKTATQHMLSIDHYQTYITARKTLALTLFLILLLAHTSTAKRFRWTVRVIIGVGAASALFGILRQFIQPPESPSGFVLPFLFYGVGYGQFISPNAFAYLMEMTLGLLAGLILGGGVKRSRVLVYLALLVVVWVALVLCNSRGGLIGLACQVLFVAFVSVSWYSERRLMRGEEPYKWMSIVRNSTFLRVLAPLLMLLILGAGVLWIGGDQLADKLAGDSVVSYQNGTDGSTRKEIWQASWKLVKSSPWTGTGFGSYFLAIPQFHLSSGRIRLEQAHNDYLDLAASGGLVGLILGAWFVVMIIRRAKSSLRHRSGYQRAATLGAVTAILGVAIHSFADFGLQITGIAVVFAVLVVISTADVPAETNLVPMAQPRSGNGAPRLPARAG